MIDLASPMPVGRRVMFGLLAFVPLIAPYELLLRPGWSTWFHPAFLFAAAIALGAVAVSAFLLAVALAGLEQRMRFDTNASTFTHWRRAPVVPARSSTWPLSSIERIEIAVHEWSDSADTYSVRVIVQGGLDIDSASSESRAEVEQYVARLRHALALTAAS